MSTAWPLQWPVGFGRSKARKRSKFSTSVSQAVNNVTDEMRRFGNDSGKICTDVVISSNVTLTQQRPADPGIAVYFRWDNIDCCIAVDIYDRPECNLQAVARIIEAERTKLRHGGLNIVRAGFRGYAALPPAKGPDGQLAPPWWKVLGFNETTTKNEAETRYRELVKTAHPDRGGDAARFNAITDAIRQARETAA